MMMKQIMNSPVTPMQCVAEHKIPDKISHEIIILKLAYVKKMIPCLAQPSIVMNIDETKLIKRVFSFLKKQKKTPPDPWSGSFEASALT